MSLVTVPCAICRSTTFDRVYSATISEEVGRVQHFGSSRTHAGHLDIVRCIRCGLVMSNPQDDSYTLATIYTSLKDEAYERESENRHHSARRQLGLVRAHQLRKGRLLDVGCASGIFASTAHEQGWRVTGIDPSDWMIARARARCPEPTFIASGFQDVSFPARAFDVITMWDVLEHLPSPLMTLTQVRQWLAPDGLLFLSVPNVGSWSARLFRRRWVLLLREHLWYFSPPTMARLLSEAGFAVVRTRTKFVRFSLANIFGRVGQYSASCESLAAGLSSARMLQRVSVRFPIGEMEVAARVARGG
jgi:2-polyprenyl-3-methyl-5-hydroxy-6-metoxy-1,4-benzoquinol methylase